MSIPFRFVLHPRTRDKLKLMLLTPFSKNREGWAHSVCINTHDRKSYRLDELSRADIVTQGDISSGYVQHPEVKSLGPDGATRKAHTRGLLRTMLIRGGLQHVLNRAKTISSKTSMTCVFITTADAWPLVKA